jgi:predicted helicase
MTNFAEFLSTLDDDVSRRGKQFERFIKWFLVNDPEWATQVADVWLWDEYPDRWGADCGIDLVFKSKLGKTWAVQAKCYAADYDISKSDVDKFLSESNRRQIDHRLLIATTDRLGTNKSWTPRKNPSFGICSRILKVLQSIFQTAYIVWRQEGANLRRNLIAHTRSKL